MRALSTLAGLPAFQMFALLLRHRKILAASTRAELAKRHAGSLLGMAWLVLQPALMLSIYLFVYLVVFKMRFAEYSEWDYVLYVFCGLIPFLGFAEALNSGCLSIRQNIHLIHNLLLPMELLPVRSVLMSMVGQVVNMGILTLLLAIGGKLGPHLLLVPFVFLLQFLLLIGVVWLIAVLAVLLPDLSYFVNFATVFLMFVSPIGFRPDMVPASFRFVLFLNPVHYMIDLYRSAFLLNRLPGLESLAFFLLCSLGCFTLGGLAFSRLKDTLMEQQ